MTPAGQGKSDHTERQHGGADERAQEQGVQYDDVDRLHRRNAPRGGHAGKGLHHEARKREEDSPDQCGAEQRYCSGYRDKLVHYAIVVLVLFMIVTFHSRRSLYTIRCRQAE